MLAALTAVTVADPHQQVAYPLGGHYALTYSGPVPAPAPYTAPTPAHLLHAFSYAGPVPAPAPYVPASVPAVYAAESDYEPVEQHGYQIVY